MANTPGISNDPYINDGSTIFTRTMYSASGTPLPPANVNQGARLWVNDATLTIQGAMQRGMAYVSGGTWIAKVQSDGLTWRIDG